MPISDFDFTFKFFRPPQRTVPVHNGLLDTRTKHIIARDRLVVAEQRILDAERRKSASNLQSLAFEQKQFEKKRALLYNNFRSTYGDRPPKMRNRSSSEVILPPLRPPTPLTGSVPLRLSKLSVSLHESKQNLLLLPTMVDSGRRFSMYSDGDTSENSFFTSDMESADEGENEDEKQSKSKSQMTEPKKKVIKREKLPGLVRKPFKPLPPIVAIIPPDEEDVLYITQTDFSNFR